MQFITRLKTLFIVTCLVFVGQGFAANDKCKTNTQWGEFKTEVASLVNGYYEIDTPEKLAWFACQTSKEKGAQYSIKAKLTQSIDLEHKSFFPIAAGPGDNGNTGFKGEFDGQGFKISNLYMNASDLVKTELGGQKNYAQNIGFVAVLGGGTIKNLILEDVDIQASTNAGEAITGNDAKDHQISVGAFVGWMAETGGNSVTGCVVSGTIKTTGNGQGVGGIVGNAKKGVISDCMSLVKIQASGSDSYIGGVIGMTKTNVTVSSCVYAGPELTNTGTKGLVGGIAGNVYSGTLVAEGDYYEGENLGGVGGSICTKNCTTVDTSNVHTEQFSEDNIETVLCTLNGKNSDGSCKTEPWSMGETSFSLNGYGEDGYRITFYATEGAFADGSKSMNKFLQAGEQITATGIVDPTREAEHYAFAGWRTKEGTEPTANLGTAAHADTIFAVWEPKVEIVFDANGGSFPLSGGAVAEKTVYVKMGSSITVEDIEALPETYCAEVDAEQKCISTMYFTGWSYKQSNVTDADILDLNGGTAGEKATNDVTIYAVWTETKTFTVKFLAQDNTTVNFVAYVDQGQHVTTRPEDPSIPGYDFVKWLDENNEEFSFDTEIEKSIVLHAEWSVHDYTITYHLNADETNHPDNPGTYNVNTPTFALGAPEKIGHTFKKWSYNQDCTDPAFEINANLSRDVDLFPCWEVKTYTISYLVGNNSYGTVSDQTKTHDVPFRLEGEGRFTRAGYSQDGWSTDIEGTNIDYPLHASYTENADLTLYPHWVKDLQVVQYGALKVFTYANRTATAEIDGEYTGTETVEIQNNITVNSVTLSRTFNAGKIATLYVPFEIDAENVAGTEVYKFKTVVKSDVDNRWKFKVSTATKIMPNTPYVIIPEGTQVTFEIPTSVTLNTTTSGEPTAANNWEFVGAYQYEKFTIDNDNPIYLFANEERDGAKLGEFVKIAEGAFINPLRAYLVYHKSAALPKSAGGNLGSNILLPDELDIEIENENGIVVQTGTLNTVTGEVRMDRWFDLKGRKLNSRPSAKGTYYKNGKKVIIK